MQDRFKFRIPMFTDKGTFMEFQYIELGDFIECTLCGTNGKPQQCTGLKDENDKLIYEGDIFRTTEGCRGKEYSCYLVVKYSEGCYFLDGSYTTSGNTVKFVNYDLRDITWDLQDSELFELVGNIYENPEFLDYEIEE